MKKEIEEMLQGEEFQRAVGLMRAMKMAERTRAARIKKALEAYEGNIYVIPEPLIYRIGSPHPS